MKVAVYIREQFYKEIDLGDVTGYRFSDIVKMVDADRKAGLLTGFGVDQGSQIRVAKVS